MAEPGDMSFLTCDDPNELSAEDREKYVDYWVSRTMNERFAEVQRLRVVKWGEAASSPMKKVLRVIDLAQYKIHD